MQPPASQPELILHVGYPKTGSTTLQSGVFLPLHREGGCNFLGNAPGFQPHAMLLRHLSNQFSRFGHRLPGLRNELNGAAAQRPDLPLVISDECLCQDHHVHHHHRDAALTAKRMRRLFRPYNTTVVMVIRNQPDIIFSCYVQEYFKYRAFPHMDSFSKYLAHQLSHPYDYTLGMFNYHRQVKLYERLFGPGRVLPLLFEELFDPAREGQAKLAAALGVPRNYLSQRLSGEHHNRRAKNREGYWREPRVLVGRRGARLLGRAFKHRWAWRTCNALYNANPVLKPVLDHTLLPPLRQKTRVGRTLIPFPSPRELKPLKDHFRESNRKLAAKFGFRLEKHGYPLP